MLNCQTCCVPWCLLHISFVCWKASCLKLNFEVQNSSPHLPALSQELTVSVGAVVVVVQGHERVVRACGMRTLQHALMIYFSSFILCSCLCSLPWMRQLLAGMIAEPAFLSEYTIFALDSSKQPKTQTESVVSPSTAFCIPCVGKQSNLVILEAYLMLLVADHLSKHLQCCAANLALKNQSINCWILMAGVCFASF